LFTDNTKTKKYQRGKTEDVYQRTRQNNDQGINRRHKPEDRQYNDQEINRSHKPEDRQYNDQEIPKR
jgi:hypothetical protein